MRSYETQVAMFNRVSALVAPTPVFDHPPQDLVPLYVQIGDFVATPSNTKSVNGTDSSFEINTYSRARGYTETKQLLDRIHNGLHRQRLTLASGQAVIPQFEFSDLFPEPDGVRGVMRFGIQSEG